MMNNKNGIGVNGLGGGGSVGDGGRIGNTGMGMDMSMGALSNNASSRNNNPVDENDALLQQQIALLQQHLHVHVAGPQRFRANSRAPGITISTVARKSLLKELAISVIFCLGKLFFKVVDPTWDLLHVLIR